MKVNPKQNIQLKLEKPNTTLRRALPLGIVLITFLCYHYSIHNEFTNWDDQRLVPQNIFIKSFSAANINKMLFYDITGDYHFPLTMISYAINYHFSGIAPESYYITNIVIHLINSCLMFFLVLMLFGAMEKNGYGILKWKEWLAFFCTLAYAIHPMHVESVSWISDRKDVLYALFYFAGMMAYIKYAEVKAKKYLWLFLVFLCFVFSILSKPIAGVFPFSLLMIDVLLKRDLRVSIKNILLEKLPFVFVFILSAVSTYYSAKSSGAVQEHEAYNLFQRFLFASYGFYMYILKAFVPFAQSAYYPYPDFTNASGGLPILFYVSPLIALLGVAIPLYLAYRSGKNNFRMALFGIGFYFFNMVMVSQIIGSGPNIMADRYSYVCYFGIFFPITFFVYKIIQKGKLIRTIVIAFVSVYMLLFAFLCYQRTLVWHNSETLWTDVIKQYPHRIIKAYNNLGNYYFEQRDLDKASDNYKEAINLRTGDPQVYCNMGSVMGAKKEYKASLLYYGEAIKIDSNDPNNYLDRAITYSAMGQYDFAIKDYRHSYRINPNSEILIRNIAYTYLNAHQFDSAISYYTQVIQINPENPGYYHYRGVAEFNKEAAKPAMDDFMHNLQIAPHDSECMFYMSIAYNRESDFKNAYKYAQMAQNAQYAVPDEYIRLLKARLDIK
ncbi:MAG TPA: tetratricopeptide repeat protein [Bacteroidia bacterium]|nr:tetratricopeptide repeat protein [Bacteroidia bacterium]